MAGWISNNWFVLLQSLGIIAGLVFTGVSLRIDARARRISNLITITEHHRDIWGYFDRRPELSRVLQNSVNLEIVPISDKEQLFVTLIVFHLSTAYHAARERMFVKPDALGRDIKEFFALPIPKAVWEKVRGFHDHDFVNFVEAHLG